MAIKAGLAPTLSPGTNHWPHHTVKWAEVRARTLGADDRRMEAETYLASGFGIRLAISSKPSGWKRLGELATISMPGRLKGIQVDKTIGVPFLAATQVFDARPVPRKWLATPSTDQRDDRFVNSGAILVTRSGSVGRAALASAVHDGTIISDDLLRVAPTDEADRGWPFAYLRSAQARLMTSSAKYGHIIKHLEESHLEELPVPTVPVHLRDRFSADVERLIALRDKSLSLSLEAESVFGNALGEISFNEEDPTGFTASASALFLGGRRRLDAAPHSPIVRTIRGELRRRGKGSTVLTALGYRVWVPGRYKRIPAADGVLYRDSANLLEASPDLGKRFADCQFGDEFKGRVRAGWVLVPSSGQVYGIIGTAVLATPALEGQVVSNHVIRIAPTGPTSTPPGYVAIALGHPLWGRPVVKSLAFGSSVPEIAPDDLASLEIVRLGTTLENRIAELAEAAANLQAEAEQIEIGIGASATDLLERFIAGGALVGTMDRGPTRRVAEPKRG